MTDYRQYSDAQLRDMHIADHYNYGVYEERLRRDRRAERRANIRAALTFFAIVAAGLAILGFVLEATKNTTFTVSPDAEGLIVLGIVGAIYLLHALGFGGGDVK